MTAAIAPTTIPAVAPPERPVLDANGLETAVGGTVALATAAAEVALVVLLMLVVKRDMSEDWYSTVTGWPHIVMGPVTTVRLRASSNERAETRVAEPDARVLMHPSKMTESAVTPLMIVRVVEYE